MPIVGTVGSKLVGSLLGGGSSGGGGGGGGAEQKTVAKKLFTPSQINEATNRYTQEGTAKWNQILANMGAGGGTGGGDVAGQIGSQAKAMSSALGDLTTESGYGGNPMANLEAILKGVEGGIGPKYSVY